MKSILRSIAQWSPIPLTKDQLYNVQIKKAIRAILNPDSNCIDVGCQEGEVFDFMSQTAPKGQHFGFEPIPDFFEELKERYMFQSNCHISDIALSNERTATHFNYVISNPSYSGLRKRSYDRNQEQDVQLLVRTDLLDHRIPEEVEIDLIRIDVQGAEYMVLDGARRVIAKDKPVVIFQHMYGASDHYDTEPVQVYDYFVEMDMEICTLAAFLNGKARLNGEEFEEQYYSRINEYFVAFPA